MRIFFFVNIILFTILPAGRVFSQGYTGKVRNDSAYIVLNIPVPADGWRQFAAQWGISPEQLIQINPTISTVELGLPTEVWMPIAHLLRNDSVQGHTAIYHIVGKSEGLYRIGKWYGNQPVSVIKARNKLRSDALKPGQQLLMGFIPAFVNDTTFNTRPVVQQISNPVPVGSVSDSAFAESKPVAKPAPPRKILSYSGEGLFASEYSLTEGGAVRKAGRASSFKSESGWADGKFYLLSSSIKPGTVVKVVNQTTGVIIYAKVVGPLPDIRQNNGLSLRVSSAAAAMLGYWEEEGAFDLSWEY